MYSQDRYLENILRLISTFALTGLNIFLDISNLHFWLVQVKSCICRISCRIYTETNFTTLSSDNSKENQFMVARPNKWLLIIKHKIQEYRTIWGQYQVINFKYFNHFFFKTRRIFLFLEYPNKYDFPKRSPMFSYPLLSCFVQYSIRTFLSKQDI